MHPSAAAPDRACLGHSIPFIRIGPRFFDQLFHVVLLFAHVSFSLDCADDYLTTYAIITLGIVVIPNIPRILLGRGAIPFY